jgi:hypothetical protein
MCRSLPCQTRIYLEERVRAFFVQALRPSTVSIGNRAIAPGMSQFAYGVSPSSHL